MSSHRPIQLGGLVLLIAIGTACSLIPGGAPANPTPEPGGSGLPQATLPLGTLPTLPPATVLATLQAAFTPTAPTAAPTIAPTTLATSAPLVQTTPGAATTPGGPATVIAPPPSGGISGPRRVTFPPGGTTAFLQNSLAPNGVDRYVLRALAAQTMSLNLVTSQGAAALVVFGADGTVLLPTSNGATTWSGKLPSTQDYNIEVRSAAANVMNYALQVTIPPLATTVPQDTPRRITFAPGATSASITGSTATNGQDRFVLRILQGQTLTATITSAQNNVILIIYGADGNVLISDHAGATTFTGQVPATQDYFIDTRSVGSNVVPFTLRVTIPPITSVPIPPAPKRISFPPGGTSVTVQGTTTANATDRWVLMAQAGQTMTVNVSSAQGQMLLFVSGIDGNVLKSSGAGGATWTGVLPSTQDYILGISTATGTPAAYIVQVTIPPK